MPVEVVYADNEDFTPPKFRPAIDTMGDCHLLRQMCRWNKLESRSAISRFISKENAFRPDSFDDLENVSAVVGINPSFLSR
jgi:hypothetical protein